MPDRWRCGQRPAARSSVTVDAGLSVPHIAGLVSNRGNPLAALERPAEALGIQIVTDLAPPPPQPTAVAEFRNFGHFHNEVAHLAKRTGVAERTARERRLAMFTAVATTVDHPLSVEGCHRISDGIIFSPGD